MELLRHAYGFDGCGPVITSGLRSLCYLARR